MAFQILALLILSPLSLIECQLSASLTPTGSCTEGMSVTVGNSCQYALTITISGSTSILSLDVQISANGMSQICSPSVTAGSNFTPITLPYPYLQSSFGTSQFDSVYVDFGNVYNSGASWLSQDDSLTVSLNIVIIDNGQVNGQSINTSALISYIYNSQNYTVESSSLLTFTSSSPSVSSSDAQFVASSSSSTIEIGGFSQFIATLSIPDSISSSVTLTASSSSLDNNPITVCSIHVLSAGSCFYCLDSVKASISSVAAKDSNQATLSLGYLINTGITSGDPNRAANSKINILVIFKSSSQSSSPGNRATISLKADIGYTSLTNQSLTFTHSTQVVAASLQSTAPSLTITSIENSNPVQIYQAFNLSFSIDFPTSFKNFMQVRAYPKSIPSNGLPQVKLCSVVVSSTGENLPCPKCLNSGSLDIYALYSAAANIKDSFVWSVPVVANFAFRNTSDYPDVNKMTLSVIGQVLNNSLNTAGSSVSISIEIDNGNPSTVETFTRSILIAANSSYTTVKPTFSISLADVNPNVYNTYTFQPRMAFFDVYTQPGAIYPPMTVSPFMDSSQPLAGSICRVEIYYVGIYSVCVQPQFVNNMTNGVMTPISTLMRFETDKMIVSLDSVCNSADPNLDMDPIDGLIRFLIHFRVIENLQSEYMLGVGVEYSQNMLTMSLLAVEMLGTLPINYETSVYGYLNTSASSSSATGRSFSVVNYVVKIPPSSLYGYNFQATLNTSQLTQGGASVCKIRITNVGDYIPCFTPLFNTYVLDSNNMIQTDYAFAGPICSVDNHTNVTNNSAFWDDDSINLEIVSRPSPSASGVYNINLTLIDQYKMVSIATESITISTSSFSGTQSSLDLSIMSTNLVQLDPSSPNYYSMQAIFYGQTSILQFSIGFNSSFDYFDLVLNFSSSLLPDQFEIERFIISNAGDNFPCIGLNPSVTMKKGNLYTYEASMNVGEVAYYPVDPTNASASIISFEAHVRIPWNSNITFGTAVSFSATPIINGQTYAKFNQILTLPVTNYASLSSYLYSNGPNNAGWSNFLLSSSQYVSIRNTVSIQFNINLGFWNDLRTQLFMHCSYNGSSFCRFLSMNIVSMGRNVDGLFHEYQLGFMPLEYYHEYDSFYMDEIELDLGIVTNTAYGWKAGNYVTDVDDLIVVNVTAMLVDDVNCNFGTILTFEFDSVYNGNWKSQTQNIIVNRTGTEEVLLYSNVRSLNSSNTVFNSGDVLLIEFVVALTNESTAEAYSLNVVFYLSAFMSMKQMISSTSPLLNYTITDNTEITFSLPRLHFDEVINCTFSIIIDPYNQYSSYIQLFGSMPSSMIQIPYYINYFKVFRALPTPDLQTFFYTNISTVDYTPTNAVPTPLPMNSISASLLGLNQPCRITSSTGTDTSNLFNQQKGWIADVNQRSYKWYESGSRFVTIAFGDLTQITLITLSQLPNSTTSFIPFTEFQLSFSLDNGQSYSFLPPAHTESSLGQSINYSIPGQSIQCDHLRVHILDVADRTQLATISTGLSIVEIYGQPPTSYSVPVSTLCKSSTDSSLYSKRTYLFHGVLNILIVCDENLNGTSSSCFSSSGLVMPSNMVSVVLLWVRDSLYSKDYLYGLAADKNSFVRSDDLGYSWKLICRSEFIQMNSTTANSRYQSSYYNIAPLPTDLTISSFTINTNGVWQNGALIIDWFD